MATKLRIALYWGAACGGCDVSVLDTDDFVLELAAAADIVFWPIAVDAKYADLEAIDDGSLDVALFSGAVRNSENEHVARVLRQKSRLLVAFGSCAAFGGIPGLANLVSRDEIVTRVYLDNPSIEPGNRAVPRPSTRINGFDLHLPTFYSKVYRLQDVVEVDYVVPGCPPAPSQVRAVLGAIVAGQLPPRGSLVGASERALCEECPRVKDQKSVHTFRRISQFVPDAERCLLEQGLLCAGPVTRAGCGVRCPRSGVGCRGCYGPLPGVADQGAKFVCTIPSVLDAKEPDRIDEALSAVPDVTGYAYRFSLPASLVSPGGTTR